MIYNLQNSITVLAEGKIRLQPKDAEGDHVTITDELANHPQVVAFSVNRRVDLLTLEESKAREVPPATSPNTEPVVAPPVVVSVPPPQAASHATPELPAVPAAPQVPAVPPLPAEPPAQEPVAAPAAPKAATVPGVSAEHGSTDTTEKDSAGNFRRRSRRR